MTNFFGHIMVSLLELIAWFLYMGGRSDLFSWYTGSIGWYFSVFWLIMPWLFALFQFAFDESLGGLGRSTTVEFSYNSIFLFSMGLF